MATHYDCYPDLPTGAVIVPKASSYFQRSQNLSGDDVADSETGVEH